MTPAEALLVADHGGDYKAACLVLAEEVRMLRAALRLGRDAYSNYGLLATPPDHPMFNEHGARLLTAWLTETDAILRSYPHAATFAPVAEP